MKRVLCITARVPYPLDDGWKIRTFHLLKGLARTGWTVDLLSLCTPKQISTAFPDLRAMCNRMKLVPRRKDYSLLDLLRGLVLTTPFLVYNYQVKDMVNAALEMTENCSYDMIQIEDVVMAQYLTRNMNKALRILDMHNIESDLLRRYADKEINLMKRLYARLTASKLQKYEKRFSGQFNQIMVCSIDDREILRRNGISIPVWVVPNGVDCEYFKPIPLDPESQELVFVGSMDYHANISGVLYFVRHVLPLIQQKMPKINFYIVGKNPPDVIQKLSNKHITVTGMVPDVRPFLARARVVVVPLLVGGGTRLKILGAMACGRAIVSTSLGAEGIAVKHGDHLMLANEPKHFAESVLKLLSEYELCRKMGLSAQKFVHDYYRWSAIQAELNLCVLALIKKLNQV